MVILDANIILRYLLNDNQEMADAAETHILSGNAQVTVEVIAEVVYVLKGIYSLERYEIAKTLSDFLDLVNCQEKSVLNIALAEFGDRNLDFVDCVLFGYHKVKGAEIATFDKKLLKLIENK